LWTQKPANVSGNSLQRISAAKTRGGAYPKQIAGAFFIPAEAGNNGTIEMPASLRPDGVRDHPGMPFGFIPDSAFGYAGIPIDRQALPHVVIADGQAAKPPSRIERISREVYRHT
jgi:hypothetical protein